MSKRVICPVDRVRKDVIQVFRKCFLSDVPFFWLDLSRVGLNGLLLVIIEVDVGVVLFPTRGRVFSRVYPWCSIR